MCRAIVAIASAITIATLSGAYGAVQTVEADNGAVYRILQVVHPWNGGPARPKSPRRITMLSIYYSIAMGTWRRLISGMRAIAPRSVAGQIAEIACAEANSRSSPSDTPARPRSDHSPAR